MIVDRHCPVMPQRVDASTVAAAHPPLNVWDSAHGRRACTKPTKTLHAPSNIQRCRQVGASCQACTGCSALSQRREHAGHHSWTAKAPHALPPPSKWRRPLWKHQITATARSAPSLPLQPDVPAAHTRAGALLGAASQPSPAASCRQPAGPPRPCTGQSGPPPRPICGCLLTVVELCLSSAPGPQLTENMLLRTQQGCRPGTARRWELAASSSYW